MKITNLFTGEKVTCEITKASRKEILFCRENYSFNWLEELKTYDVFKLTTEENPKIIQALFSYSISEDFIWLSKIERANFRSLKVYAAIVETIVGFTCRKSFELGFEGYVSFEAKTKLIPYYRTILGAIQLGHSQRMYVSTEPAKSLVNLIYEESS
ncbi:MAG TPA: hypothetical protein VE978_17070 [Chitinophagales bacterium]|nr:hypothetical protein [Chitinophagales bacterium]